MRRFGLMVSISLAMCFLQSWLGHRALMAQQILIRMDGGNEAQLETYNQLKNIYESKRSAAKNRINSQLNDIDRACDLSAEQRERLKVAGKGAVKSYAEKILKKLKTNAKAVGLEFALGDPPKKANDDEEEIVGRQGGRMQVLNLGNGRNGDTHLLVEAEKIWTSSVKKSLDEEQLKKFRSWLTDRKKLNQQAAVDHLIAKVDLKLFLSLQQREQLKAFVDKEYGKLLASNIGANTNENRRFVFAAAPQQAQAIKIKVDDALKEILSEPQLEIWRTEFQKDLDSLNNNGLNGVVNFLLR